MSWSGTAVSATVAAVAFCAAEFAGFPRDLAWMTAAGVFLAPVVDSVLGATLEAHLPRAWSNHLVNGLATGVAGGLVLWAGVPA